MRRLATAAALLLLWTSAAAAQTRDESLFRRGAIEVDAGGFWQGGLPMGSRRATLTGNQQGTPPVTFFETSSEFQPGAGFEGRVGVHLTRVFAVEGGIRFARPRLETRITADFEDAPDITATQDLSQYVFDVSGVAHLNNLRFAGGGVPFLFGGAGYLRELYEGRQVAETGQMYHAGGGVKLLFRQSPRAFLKGLGIRVDARLLMRRGGVELEEDEPLRTYSAVAGGMVIVF
jgi:hypothetical protein